MNAHTAHYPAAQTRTLSVQPLRRAFARLATTHRPHTAPGSHPCKTPTTARIRRHGFRLIALRTSLTAPDDTTTGRGHAWLWCAFGILLVVVGVLVVVMVDTP